MDAHWCYCTLGLLCTLAEVLGNWTVSQDPLSISLMRVNLSAEITCSTTLSNPLGLVLHRSFHRQGTVVFLSLENGLVTQNTEISEFAGRIRVALHQRIGKGHKFTLQLSLLGLEDTDLYYCSWIYFKKEMTSFETLPSDGTVIIVRERDPHEQCGDQISDFILFALSVMALTLVLFLAIGALNVRRKRFKKQFRIGDAVKPPRHNRPQHICPQQGVQHDPYLITSVNPLGYSTLQY